MRFLLELLRRRGLKWNLMFGYVVLLVLVSATMGWVLNAQIGTALTGSLKHRGESILSGLATRGQLPLLQQKQASAQKVVDSAFEYPDVAFAALVTGDGKTLASRFAPKLHLDPNKAITTSIAELGKQGVDKGSYVQFSEKVMGTKFSDEEMMLGGGDLTRSNEQTKLGFVVLGMSKASLRRSQADMRLAMTIVVLVGVGAFFLLSLFITRVVVLRPINSMKSAARRVGDFDLTGRAEKFADDELGEMADGLNRIAENLHGVLGRMQGVTDSLATVSDRVSRNSEVVASGASSTSSSVDQTSSSMQEMLASLKGIADNVEVLAQSAEESSSSILEMAATNDEVAQNIGSLAASVEETTTAIEQMTYSIKEVAQNIEDLSSTAEETSSSMNEMDVSIGQVETNANETARLSEQVSADAAKATEALGKTIDGIDKIRDSSQVAADVIELLGQKIETIGNILNVIDDVAEQTNLLALNAAIIAAQAGEHGKGFAVVADEIKDLAERTGASTKEIADLIRSVQDESKNAISAMERGVKNVDDGVRLSGEAEKALQQITLSANQATQMVKAIARATVEQARGSKQVTGAINRIAETVQEIARATAEQARGSEQIMKSAERMKIITKHVERSSQEQARGSKQITQAIESISEMVQQLNRAQKEQTKGAEQVMLAVENIKDATDGQNTAVKDLEAAVDTLAEQAEVLRGEVRRFRV